RRRVDECDLRATAPRGLECDREPRRRAGHHGRLNERAAVGPLRGARLRIDVDDGNGAGLRRVDGEMQCKCGFTDATLLGDHRDRQHVELPKKKPMQPSCAAGASRYRAGARTISASQRRRTSKRLSVCMLAGRRRGQSAYVARASLISLALFSWTKSTYVHRVEATLPHR